MLLPRTAFPHLSRTLEIGNELRLRLVPEGEIYGEQSR
jgi:hypothetical protein